MAAINSELASFYSDLASIESTTTTASANENSTTIGGGEVAAGSSASAADELTDSTKKKKRKIKKLQPWRSGNLETWINKWQKAQKELDN